MEAPGGLGGAAPPRNAPAQAAEVVSSNIVGYEKLTIYPTWTMIANSFVEVGKDSVAEMNKMFDSAETTIAGGENESMSDNLQVWTGSTYTTYYFGNWGTGDEYDNQWYEFGNDAEPTLDEIPAGNGAWFKNYTGSQKQVTISGQVGTNDVQVTVGATWTMLAYPYPADLPLNGVVDWASAGVTGGENESMSDNIQLWVGTTYKTYYFGNWGTGDEYDDKWYEFGNDAEPTQDVIPAGTAVWYKNFSGTPFTITFQSPIK